MSLPELIEIKNGQPPRPTFSDGEMKTRLIKLRNHMKANDIHAAILTSIQNVNYFADFVYCAFGRPYALIVTYDRVTTLTANIDGGQPYRQTYGHDNLVYTDWKKDNFFRGVTKLVPNQGTVGIEYDHVTLERKQKFEQALDNAKFVDIGIATMHMRIIKSAEEHALIRQGARICDIGGAAVVEAVDENVPEYEVALHATQAMVRAIAKTLPHTELMDTWTWFQSGINTDGAHNPVTTRRVQKGDILSLNCFSMLSGYYHALERTLFYHHCSDAHLKLWEVNCEVHREGLKLVKPGLRCMDLALELNKIFENYNLLEYRTFGYGHSFGSLCHYYGREAGLEFREDIETVLVPGMVVSIEPMIMLPENMPGAGGYREHDILIVTEDGAENITHFPFGPEHNILQ